MRVTKLKRHFAREQLRITGVIRHREVRLDVVLSAFTLKTAATRSDETCSLLYH
jgi:hypothetical protein